MINKLSKPSIKKPLILGFVFSCFILSGCSKSRENDTPILIHSFREQYVNYILVPVSIQGEIYTFLLDTGSSTSIIDKSLVGKVTRNINEPPDIYKGYFNSIKTVSAVKKINEVSFVDPIHFYIGGKYFNGGDFWASNDLDLLSQLVGEKISGVLGIDIFRRLNWEVDNKNKILTLYDNPPSSSNYEQCVRYGDYSLNAPSFEAFFADKTYISIKLDTGSKENYVSDEFINYLHTIMTLEKVRRFDNEISVDFSGVSNKKENVYFIKEFKLGSALIKNQYFSENLNNSFAIGMSTLDSFDKYLLSPDRMLLCYNLTKHPKPILRDVRKINLRMFNDNIEVFYNKESVLSEFGLNNSDILISLNGVKYPKNELLKVQSIMNTLPKGQVSLIISRQGRLVEIKF